ncbi:MAG TPA: ComEC/Rec2 family competence protein [Gaiellaceae bacterium]|nr:ComEC/Rec2 family competence protein [Gaiellaceae bacterium]
MTGALLERYAPHVLAGALCVGLALASFVRSSSNAVFAVALVGAVASVVAVGRRGRVAALVLALGAGGLWWGSVRLDALDRSLLASRIGETGRALLEVTGPARRSPFSIRVPARVRSFRSLHLRESVLLELPPGRAPPQGALIETAVELREPREPSDGFDERVFLRRRGVHVVARGREWRLVGRRGGIAGFADRVRERLGASIAPGLAGERRAVLAGLVLGEDEGLSQELRDDFRSSGLYHLLAVSGQNVAFVAGGVLVLAWLLGISRVIGELGALGAIGAYVLAVGWQPSVVRAGVAGALASLAWLAARPRDRWYFLLLGAALLLAWNPYSLYEPGFQLSFAAVAAIFVLVPRLEHVLEGYPIPTWLATIVAVSGACGAVTAPILLFQFGSVPVYSILSNALAAPVVGVSFTLALVTALLDQVLPPAAVAAGWVNGWLAAYVAACARLVGGLPGADVEASVALAIGGMAAVALLVWARLPRWRRPGIALVASLAVLVAAAWQIRPQASRPPPSGFRLTVLDVGQGDAILLEVREGAVLVDQGPPEGDVDDQLRKLGVRELSLAVLTHPQRDHVGGAAELLRHVRVARILDPRIPAESPEQAAALAEARERRVPVLTARAGLAFRLGGLRLRVLWPAGEPPEHQDPNLFATVILASYGSVDVLLTADAESPVTLPLNPPPVEILKVAHHGSADDGLPRLLTLTRPEVAVISCGKNNDYGHPTPSTLAALDAAPGLEVFRTDRHGGVVIESDGRRITTRTGA